MQVTYYVVQSYELGKRGALIGDPAVQVQSEGHAARMAKRLALTKAGVVAFSREGDPAIGEYEDATIIFSAGELPAEAEDLAT